jgi:glyoxylase-like metal-dependent hydrolase (beta-lactamase superfamily II)
MRAHPTRLAEGLYAFTWTDPTVNNCNSYLIEGERPVLVDPGHLHLFDAVRDHLRALSLSQDEIHLALATHGHPDHAEGLLVFRTTGTLTALPEEEAAFFGLSASGLEPDFFIREGRLEVGGLILEVLLAPGHSPGSCCLYWPLHKALFSGDVVFQGGVGRTDLPGGDSEALGRSLERLSALDVEILLPGHGSALTGRDAVRRNFEEIARFHSVHL